MAEEIKFTIKSAGMAAAVATLIMAIFGCMWGFHGRITTLETQHTIYVERLNKLDKIEGLLYEVRQDQVRREIKEKRGP